MDYREHHLPFFLVVGDPVAGFGRPFGKNVDVRQHLRPGQFESGSHIPKIVAALPHVVAPVGPTADLITEPARVSRMAVRHSRIDDNVGGVIPARPFGVFRQFSLLLRIARRRPFARKSTHNSLRVINSLYFAQFGRW